MRQLTRGRTTWRRTTRGVAFLWTILIAMPLMFFGLSMAVDFTRIILAHREMSTATHAAALAGAYQFNTGKATINPAAATAAAVETLCVSLDQGAVKNAVAAPTARKPCPSGPGVSAAVTLPTPSSVQVTTRYRIDGLLMMKYFDYGSSDQVVSRTAAVCNSADTSGPTAGFCTRPSN